MKRIIKKDIVELIKAKGYSDVSIVNKNSIPVHGVYRPGYLISFESPCEVYVDARSAYGVEILEDTIKCHKLSKALEFIKTMPTLTTYDD